MLAHRRAQRRDSIAPAAAHRGADRQVSRRGSQQRGRRARSDPRATAERAGKNDVGGSFDRGSLGGSAFDRSQAFSNLENLMAFTLLLMQAFMLRETNVKTDDAFDGEAVAARQEQCQMS